MSPKPSELKKTVVNAICAGTTVLPLIQHPYDQKAIGLMLDALRLCLTALDQLERTPHVSN